MFFYETNFNDVNISVVIFARKSDDNIQLNYSNINKYNEIFLKFEGDNTFHYDNVHANITKETIGFLPKTNHSITYTIDVKKSSDSINIFFLTSAELPKEAQFFDCSDIPNLSSLFIKFERVWNSKKVGYYEEALSIFHKIISTLQVHLSSNYIPQKKYAIISDSITYLEQHFLDKDFNLEKLAAMSGISFSYYKKIFKKKFNMTPKQYLNKLKLNYTCSLLKTHRYTITQIAEMAGYNDIYYFTHSFKKNIGLTPTEYAKHY